MTAPPSRSELEARNKAGEKRDKEAKVEPDPKRRGIEAGTHEPVSGLPYGMWHPKKGAATELSSESINSGRSEYTASSSITSPLSASSTGPSEAASRPKFLRPGTGSNISLPSSILQSKPKQEPAPLSSLSSSSSSSSSASTGTPTAANQSDPSRISATTTPSVPSVPSVATLGPSVALSVDERNKLHAALMRFQMLGNAAKVEEIQRKLDLADQYASSQASSSSSSSSAIGPSSLPPSYPHADREIERVEVVPFFDASGRVLPTLVSGSQAPLTRDDIRGSSRRGKVQLKGNKRDEEGERTGYFPSDTREYRERVDAMDRNASDAAHSGQKFDSASVVANLLREEKSAAGAEDMDATLARNILRKGKMYKGAEFAGTVETMDLGMGEMDAESMEDTVQALLRPEDRLTERERQKREKATAIRAQQKYDQAVGNCSLCMEGKGFAQHRVISAGENVLLLYPPEGQRIPGHLVLTSIQHVQACTELEEGAFAELNRFKVALHKYFQTQDEDVLFVETAKISQSASGRTRHLRVEVLPMDKEVAFDAPLYFRKEIVDSEQWTTNKTLIETAGKGLRKCVPPGFSYFHVSWAGGGFVHPIEDEQRFPSTFGIDIAAGMLGLDPGSFGRREKRVSIDEEKAVVANFAREFRPFDFTFDQ